MIEHVVLFQWKTEASLEAIRNVLEELRLLKGRVPGIVDLTCGENLTDRAQGFTHCLVVRFTDRAALEAYGPHPAHRRVVEDLINPILATLLALDYEF